MTERLFLEDPARAHCLADVLEVRGRAIVLSRSVLYGESRAYGHPQPSDRGHILAEGRKTKIDRASERDGLLLHHLANEPPSRGARVQVHLDLPRRQLVSRAHTLAHLLAHVARDEGLDLLAPPRILGNGGVRVRARRAPEGLVRRLEREVEADRRLSWRWVSPEDAPEPWPWPAVRGEGALRVVEVEGLGAALCDGTHARRTTEVGRIRGRMKPAAAGGVDLELQLA